MINAIRTRLDEREEGFTLIELLVVVIIIGILAAIAIPTFLAQRERGWEAQAQSDLRNAVLAVESCATAQGGNYVTPLDCGAAAQLDANGYNPSPNVTVTVTAGAATFTATSTHALLTAAGAPDTYSYDSATGRITGPA